MIGAGKFLTAWVFVAGLSVGSITATEYKADLAHSEILFKVKHMGISTVTGKFDKFDATFDVDPKHIEATKGSAVIDVNSINTSVERRDNHLKSEDFFDAAHFPQITFTSKAVKDVNMADSTCTLIGDLTMHGVTKEIALKIKGGGVVNDGRGGEHAAFTAIGRLNRFDYGLKWNKLVEAGGMVVGQDVDLVLAFEGVHKLENAAMPAESTPAKAAVQDKVEKKK